MATTANHVWRPSASRALVLDGFLPGPRGLPVRPPATLQWPAKDPGDVLDYQLDIAPAVYGNDGDEISTLDVLITPSNVSDLSLLSSVADGTKAILWLQGGIAGTIYSVALTIGTQAGRQISRAILLPSLPLPRAARLVSRLSSKTERHSSIVVGTHCCSPREPVDADDRSTRSRSCRRG